MMDYKEMATDDLWSMADEVLSELEGRIREEQEWSREAEDITRRLGHILRYDDEELYTLTISVEPEGFSIEWRTEDSGFTEGWRRTDGESGVPDKSLLLRNPVLWLMNLKVGKYEVEAL